MKKRLLAIATMALATFSIQAAAGDDLTGNYLKNADFSADEPLREGICTYAKDVAANGTTLSGMQPVTDWTASNPFVEGGTDIDARSGGVFELGKQYLGDYTGKDEDAFTPLFLGGSSFITPAPEEGITEGNVLGLVAVWGANLQYTQTVTLPAGAYSIEIPVYNGGGETAVAKDLFGFIAEDGTKYIASETTWGVNVWTTMKVDFMLSEETTGQISLGYTAAGAGSSAMPHLYVAHVKILEGDKAAIEKVEVDKLKEDLLPLLEAAEELSVDASDEQAVYDNDNATLAEVQAAIDSLKEKNANAMTDFTDFFINNAHFALGTPLDNGVCTYDYDMEKNSTKYYGMQTIQDWTASNPSTNTVEGVNNGRASGLFAVGSPETVWLGGPGFTVPATKANGATEGNLFGFISVWTASSNYTQNVTLPAGSYTITIPTYNGGGAGTVAKNLSGFIADDGTEYLAQTTSFPVGKWNNETIKFKLEEETSGIITIGYQAANAGSGSMPHLFIDEFTLMFNGKTDVSPSLIALNGAIRNGENYLDSEEPYYAELKTTLEEAIEKGNELKDNNSSDDEANTAAATAINTTIADIKTSQATYKKFNDFIEGKLTQTIDKYDASEELSDFAGTLSDDRDEYTSAYEDGTITNDEINAILNGFNDRLAVAVKEALDKAVADGAAHNIDITCLFADKNLDFAKNTVTGWNNETGTSAFLSRVQTAEVWNQSNFNCYVELENLPAGVYELQIPGFYRVCENVSNYERYANGEVGGSSYVYIGGNKTQMHNVAEVASSDNQNRIGVIVEDELYVPNSNDNAHYFFYDQSEYDVTNTVRGALIETGTLTIGVKGENLEGNEWTVWGAATLIYKGSEGIESTLYSELLSKAEDLKVAEENAALVIEADNKAQDALGMTEECSEESSVEELTKAIKAVDEATAYAKESAKLLGEIENIVAIYNDYLAPNVDSEEPTFLETLEAAYAALEEGFESNEAIVQYKNKIQDTWATFVQYPVLQTASDDEPGNISDAILNRGFEGIINDQTTSSGSGNGDYWTKSRVGGNDFGYQAGVYESWNTDTFDIHQSIKGLAQGYYRIKVQSFFRAENANQNNANAFAADTTHCAAYLYANDSQKAIINQVERGDDGAAIGTDGNEAAIIYGENAEFYVPSNRTGCAAYFDAGLYWNTLDCYVGEDGILTLGIKKESHVYGDWCPFDNFELYYLGATAPTGIKNVDKTSNAGVAISRFYTVGGQQISRLQKGVNIIQTTLSDGTVRTNKVIVK